MPRLFLSTSNSCPPPSPPLFLPPVDLSWLCLYVGALVCGIAIMLTRHTYKLSEGFRRRVAKTGFASVDEGADPAVKAGVMLAVFSDCWPSTVSELIEDTEAAHGMVFRSLMVMGGLCALCCDFASLSPAPSRDVDANVQYLIGCVHVLRRLMMAAMVGFCFAPATGRDHGVANLRSVKDGEEVVSARLGGGIKIKELCRHRRLQFGRTAVAGSVHVLLALLMLSALPFLELVALGYDAWAIYPELRVALEGGSICASVWLALTGLRLVHVVAINVGLMLFAFHFSLGFFTATGGHSYKGFWAEYATCVNFSHLMLLGAISGWFKDFDAFETRDAWAQGVAFAVAGAHASYACAFCGRNLRLCARNVEYSERTLAHVFDKYKRDEVVFQTLLDVELAFIARVQREMEGDAGWWGSAVALLTLGLQDVAIMTGLKRCDATSSTTRNKGWDERHMDSDHRKNC